MGRPGPNVRGEMPAKDWIRTVRVGLQTSVLDESRVKNGPEKGGSSALPERRLTVGAGFEG